MPNRKPKTYADIAGYRPKLSVLMTCYGSVIRQNPKAWLRGMQFSEAELLDYPDIAEVLACPVQVSSEPIVINLQQAA